MIWSACLVILKMSGIASIVAIPLLSVKYVLQKIGFPRRILFLLWGIIAFRLLCPIAIPSSVSVLHVPSVWNNADDNSLSQPKPVIGTEVVAPDVVLPNVQTDTPDAAAPVHRMKAVQRGFALVWLAGAGTMLLYGIVSYLLLKKRLRFAVKSKDNVYTAQYLSASFVFGVFRPKIFIPETVSEQDLEYIILHETTHWKRSDHITKLAAYFILSLHWFNPLCWVMFRLFSDDMELACDEAVIQKIGMENKRQYVNTLLENSVSKSETILLYRVCFSAHLTKRRIKNIIRLNRRSRVMTVLAVLICIFAGMVFGTNAAGQTGMDIPFAARQPDTAPAVFTKAEGTGMHPLRRAAVSANTADNTPPVTRDTKPQPPVQNTVDESIAEAVVSAPDGQWEEPDDCGIDMLQRVYEEDMEIAEVAQRLHNKGITRGATSDVRLGENYIVNEYSYETNCAANNANISCDQDGRISMFFDVNMESLVDVTFLDAETKAVVAQFGILANGVNAYSFTGFREDKTYDVLVQGKTRGTWEVEGQYILY